MQRLPFLLERSGLRPIHGQWHQPEIPVRGSVLFLHGYKGYMDWGAWDRVGDLFALNGWRFLRINFTHNGTTPESPREFTDLQAFASNTYRMERDEAIAVLHAMRVPGHPADSTASSAPLAVLGHSRGGGIACLAGAAADTQLQSSGKSGVDAIITWAAVADFAARFPVGAALESWRTTGRLEVLNHRTRQYLHHDWQFLQDFKEHEQELTISRAVGQYGGRMLIAHGTGDQAVPVDHAHQLAKWAHAPTLALREGDDHTFGAKEPWTDPLLPAPLEALTQTTLHFLEEGRAVQ